MNPAVDAIAREFGLDDPARDTLRLAVGYACVERVRHLVEQAAVIDCLEVLARFVDGCASVEALETARSAARRLASGHEGSRSLDGCGHAAVSATYAISKALDGRYRDAADYAAYAMVYAQGGSAAVADRSSFQDEYLQQQVAMRRVAGAARARE